MLSVSTDVLDQIKKSSSITMLPAMWAEYNMNDLIDGVTVTNLGGDTATVNGYTPFAKLFPISSIINTRRPSSSGIKYFISNNSGNSSTSYEVISKYNTIVKEPYRLYYPGPKNQYQYWVTPKSNGTSLTDCKITVAYPSNKSVVANKIAIKFETSYGTKTLLSNNGTDKTWSDMTFVKPTAWTIKIVKGSTTTTISTNGSVPDNGVFNLYWNGSTWSTTEFDSPSTPVAIDSIIIEVASINVPNTYLGFIEVSARLVKDLTTNLQDFSTQKTSSDDSGGISPVGNVTSNSLTANLFFEDYSGISYDKTFTIDNTKTYFYSNVLLKPFYKIKKTDGTFENIKQGYFYIDSWSVDKFGAVSLQALDGANFLQKIICPDILIQDAPSPAIVKRLLDGIGFTSYNFNMGPTDSSSITPYFWYTDDTKTVWQCIQDLCRDTQMIASFDEDNILQFYTREWLYDKNKSKSFTFRYNPYLVNGTITEQSNIIDFSKEDLPSIKAVKVLYRPQMSSAYNSSADLLWQSPEESLGAGALTQDLLSTVTTGGSLHIQLLTTLDGLDLSAINKTGYLVINDEIIEYDAIKYSYRDLSGNKQTQWITSDTDLQKYQALGQPNSFMATGEYRIKTRGAFKTAISDHFVGLDKTKQRWSTYLLNKDTQLSTGSPALDNSKISFISTDSMGNQVPRSMLTVNPPSTLLQDVNYVISITDTKFIDSNLKNFAIGTSFYFPLIKDSNGYLTGKDSVIGGVAFCVADNGATGYFLEVRTEQTTATKKLTDKNVTLWKFKKGSKPYRVAITDSQTNDSSTVVGVGGGELYKVDIKVNYDDTALKQRRTFKINFNNTTITATDLESGSNHVLPITEKVGLFTQKSPINFDYVYTSSLTDDQFASTTNFNIYSGMLGSKSTLTNLFGDFTLSTGVKDDTKRYIDEFGPVARELKYVNAKYAQRPGRPRFAQLTLNPFVTLVGSKVDSFSIEAYVLNNAGTFVPLADGQSRSFQVVGDQIIATDPFEYIDPEVAKLKNVDQIGFDSVWIQKEQEAKKLSDWMMTQWTKQQKIVNITCFANPLLQIGDIIEVSYPLNDIYSSEDTLPSGKSVSRFVVLDISHSWNQGLSTTVKGRSIYVS